MCRLIKDIIIKYVCILEEIELWVLSGATPSHLLSGPTRLSWRRLNLTIYVFLSMR
jgi:hypothetical protein